MKKQLLAIAMIMFCNAAYAQPYDDLSELTPPKQAEMKKRFEVLALNPELPELRDNSIQGVNEFVNSFKYDHNGMSVHWKTPAEFFRDSGGDCKDYAIVKYHYLKKSHDVKVMVGLLRNDQEGHAVLLVDNKYVLDNRFNAVITKDQARTYMKIYGYFTDKGMIVAQDER